MCKCPSLLFSGGLDSTAMLLRAAKEHRRVRSFYVKGGQGGLKALIELAARRRIIRAIEEMTGCTIVDNIFELCLDAQWHQTAQWLLVAAASHTVGGYDATEVQIGYVHGDDAIGLIPTLREVWPGLSKLASGIRGFTAVPLRFPLAEISKEELYRELPVELRRLIWSCELPEYSPYNQLAYNLPDTKDVFLDMFRPCGRCTACRRFYVVSHDERYRDRNEHCTAVDEVNLKESVDLDRETTTDDDAGVANPIVLCVKET